MAGKNGKKIFLGALSAIAASVAAGTMIKNKISEKNIAPLLNDYMFTTDENGVRQTWLDYVSSGNGNLVEPEKSGAVCAKCGDYDTDPAGCGKIYG